MTDPIEEIRKRWLGDVVCPDCPPWETRAQRDIAALLAEVDRLRAVVDAARLCQDALDRLMGDSDINGDGSPEFVAMSAVSAALRALDESEGA